MKAVDLGLAEIAYRAHRTKLFSDYLKIEDQIHTLVMVVRSRTGVSPYEPEPQRYTKVRQYLDGLADALLKAIPERISEEGLKRAKEEARYFGMPLVNGKYPVLVIR